MAQKRGASRRSTTTKKKTRPVKKRASWWHWVVIIGVVGLFGYFLSRLAEVSTPATSAPAPKQVQPAAPKPAPKPAPAAKPAEQPKAAEKPAKEQFEFYQLLQDSEVDTSHVDAYQSTPRGEQDFYYMIQAASFRSSSDADRLRAQLLLQGLDAAIRQTTGDDGRPWYRVIIGPFNSRSEKNRAQDKLVAMDIQSYTYTVKKEQ